MVPSGAAVLTRPFIGQVRRCEETLHKLSNLEQLLSDRSLSQQRSELTEEAFADLRRLFQEQYERSAAHPAAVLNDIVQEVDGSWSYYQDLTKRS